MLTYNKDDFFIHFFYNDLLDQMKVKTSTEISVTWKVGPGKEQKKVGIYSTSSYYIRGYLDLSWGCVTVL